MKKWVSKTIIVGLTLITFLSIGQTAFTQSTTNPIGEINPPPGVEKYESSGSMGLFITNLIKIATLIAGLWVLINFVTAGFLYISSTGDAAVNEKVSQKLTASVSGLMIIVASYTLIGVISYIFFGSPSYIINLNFATAP